MSEKDDGLVIDKPGGAPSIPANNKPVGEAEQPRQTQRGKAPDMSQSLNVFGRRSELSKEANEYLKNLGVVLNAKVDGNVEIVNVPDTILDVYRVTYDNKVSVLLTMAETYSSANNAHIPPTEFIFAASELTRQQTNGGVKNNIVIVPADYVLCEKMATHLASIFNSHLKQDMIPTIDTIANGKFSISTDVIKVREAIDQLYPKATTPRTDIGLVVYYNERVENTTGYGPKFQTRETPVLVVGGYSRFFSAYEFTNNNEGINAMNMMNGVKRKPFIGSCALTSILSPFMAPEMLALAIPLATAHMVQRHGWITPYLSFNKKEPNLGSLIPTESGKPYFAENIDKLMEHISNNINTPLYMSIDVTDGLPRIPGIEEFKYSDCGGLNSRITEATANFFGVTREQAQNNITCNTIREYIGEFDNGKDTRCVDHINMAANGIVDMKILMRLMAVGVDPSSKQHTIAEYWKTDTLYGNVHVTLNHQYVESLGATVASRFKPLWDNMVHTPDNNIGNLAALSGNQFQAADAFGMGMQDTNWGYNTGNNPFR